MTWWFHNLSGPSIFPKVIPTHRMPQTVSPPIVRTQGSSQSVGLAFWMQAGGSFRSNPLKVQHLGGIGNSPGLLELVLPYLAVAKFVLNLDYNPLTGVAPLNGRPCQGVTQVAKNLPSLLGFKGTPEGPPKSHGLGFSPSAESSSGPGHPTESFGHMGTSFLRTPHIWWLKEKPKKRHPYQYAQRLSGCTGLCPFQRFLHIRQTFDQIKFPAKLAPGMRVSSLPSGSPRSVFADPVTTVSGNLGESLSQHKRRRMVA